MKNIFKLFSLMLVAGTVMVSCDKPNNTPTHQTPKYTITVNANNDAYGTVTGGGTYEGGQQCTVTLLLPPPSPPPLTRVTNSSNGMMTMPTIPAL